MLSLLKGKFRDIDELKYRIRNDSQPGFELTNNYVPYCGGNLMCQLIKTLSKYLNVRWMSDWIACKLLTRFNTSVDT